MTSPPPPRAASRRPDTLFVGLATVDVVQLVDRVPASDEKLVARAQHVAAGGPATNAAVLYAHLGGTARLLTGIGRHPLAAGITADLDRHHVHRHDLAAEQEDAPTVSTVLVTRATGERAVVSTNASAATLAPPTGLERLLHGRDAVLLDGHHPRVALAAARTARALGIRTVLDGGSFKPGTEALLAHIDIAACSAAFRPPGCRTPTDTLSYLHDRQVTWAAVTDGPDPVLYSGPGCKGIVPVPSVERVADTLGAGDFFHGALLYRLTTQAVQQGTQWAAPDAAGFEDALAFAARTAARSVASFGTREWLRRR